MVLLYISPPILLFIYGPPIVSAAVCHMFPNIFIRCESLPGPSFPKIPHAVVSPHNSSAQVMGFSYVLLIELYYMYISRAIDRLVRYYLLLFHVFAIVCSKSEK